MIGLSLKYRPIKGYIPIGENRNPAGINYQLNLTKILERLQCFMKVRKKSWCEEVRLNLKSQNKLHRIKNVTNFTFFTSDM